MEPLEMAVKLAENFVKKVDDKKAFSRETYKECKKFLGTYYNQKDIKNNLEWININKIKPEKNQLIVAKCKNDRETISYMVLTWRDYGEWGFIIGWLPIPR